MRPLTGQTVLITGATDGLGRALAVDLAGRGMTVLAHGRSEERLAALREELGVRTHPADLASLAEVRAMAEQVEGDVDPGLDDVTGRYFDGLRETRAHDQAYDAEARRRLRTLSDELVG